MNGIGRRETFDEMLSAAETRDAYWIEYAKLDFALSLARVMDASGLKDADLASRSGESLDGIAEVLRADADLTVARMVKIARAAGGTLRVHVSTRIE